ncbi:MAG TPA: TIGR03960 family B12-binding radical SAM protein [Anaerolineae bacterium]|nr:TIGR03960 family B12-binding radical SAM protein [Anaerolineae bacterium]
MAHRHWTPERVSNLLNRVLPSVEKPARYAGGEHNSVVKDWHAASVRAALVFPDVYELGMSNLGLAILYDILNRRPDLLAERAYSPWTDMEAIMRREGMPLFSLETRHPLADFDLIGVSLPYEQLYSNVVNLLDLAGMPIFAADRDATHPIVVAGGHATYNPDPMADFVDAFAIGEGEDIILDFADVIKAWKEEIGDLSNREKWELRELREGLLRRIARIDGAYVPSLYEATYHLDGTIAEVKPAVPEAPARIAKRIVPVLPPPVTKLVVPFLDITHNRAPIEIMRGCTRGCRFCHAGMVTRPVRERRVEEVVRAAEEILEQTGFEEIALLSLSSSDYTHVKALVRALADKLGDKNLSISLPSLRIETASADLLEALGDNKRGGFTFAPEAATEHMRRVINKYIPTPQVIETAREVYSRGWRTIKLYFMIGHPAETMEDVQAIVDLAKRVLAEGRRFHGKAAQVNIGASTFVPKPHTPFQWVPLDDESHTRVKQALLRRELRKPGLKVSWTDPEETLLEAYLSRGDRRLGGVIYRAWQLGAKFDAWQEHHKPEAWNQAFAEQGLDPNWYARRPRPIDEVFPWDHIDIGVTKKFLLQDFLWSADGKTRVDCREHCFACGILPKYKVMRMNTPGDAWECPEVKPYDRRGTKPKSAAEVIPLQVVNVA